MKPRCRHSLTAFSLGRGQTEVTVFEGTAMAGSDEKQSKLADLYIADYTILE